MEKTPRPKKRQFMMKITLEQYEKIDCESKKIWLNKTAFISLLLADYKWIEIHKNNIK